MSRWRTFWAAALLILSGAASARTYTVDDLLRSEDFGALAFDPQDRWLVFERRESFLKMGRFDMLARAAVLRSRLYRVDLRAPFRAAPLLPDAQPGTILYGFSSGGTRLAIGRLAGERWQLGIVTMATGAVRWFDLSPDYNPFHVTLRWISDERLVVIANPAGQRPWWLRVDSLPADRLPARWAATRSGVSAAVTTVGSGRFRGAGDRLPDNRLVLVEASTGATTVLATGHFLAMEVAPDRDHLALIEQGEATPLPQDHAVSLIDMPFRRILSLYDLRARAAWHPCPDCDVQGMIQWSVDGRGLAFVARRGGEDWAAASAFELNIAPRSLARLEGHGVVPAIAQFPDGSARMPFAWRGKDILLLGQSASGPNRRTDWYRLRGRGAPQPLTANLSHVGTELSRIGRCAAAMRTADGPWCLDGAKPQRMQEPGTGLIGDIAHMRDVAGASGRPGRTERVEISPSGKAKAVQILASDGTKTLFVASASGTAIVDRVNLHLRDVQPAEPRRLTYRLPGGGLATGWLYLPPGAPAGRSHPLVVIPYLGQSYGEEPPNGQGPASARFHANAQILAGGGYAVLLPSLPLGAAASDKGSGFVEEVDLAVDAAIKTGTVDPRRIALWGHSYGGYAAAAIASRSCRYASIIASAGVYDLGAVPGIFGPTLRLASELALPIGSQFAWAETGQARLGVPPWIDPAAYVAASPYYRAGHIATPMLIVAADRDPSPMQQAEQLFSALYRQDKDAQLLTYWGEGHVVGSPANVRDLYARVFAWLDDTMNRPRAGPCAPRGSPPPGLARRAPNAPSG
nr:prolyl oligopeptidase family serine peptidase [Sphingomonas sp. CDS-1]